MTDFQRDAFEHRANTGQRAEILSMPVPLNHLRCHGSDAEPEPLADALFDFRAKVRCRADCAGYFPHRHLRGGIAKACDVALVLGKPIGYFQSKSNGLRMDAVGAADLRRVAKFMCAKVENLSEHHQIALD